MTTAGTRSAVAAAAPEAGATAAPSLAELVATTVAELRKAAPLEPRVVTVPQAAEALNLSAFAVRDLIANHGLPVLGGTGRAVRIPVTGLDRWIEQNTHTLNR